MIDVMLQSTAAAAAATMYRRLMILIGNLRLCPSLPGVYETDVTQCGWFPLTPALSPRERENRRQCLSKLEALGFGQRRGAWLPLRKGEGWGEGKRCVRPIQGARLEPDGFDPFIVSSLGPCRM